MKLWVDVLVFPVSFRFVAKRRIGHRLQKRAVSGTTYWDSVGIHILQTVLELRQEGTVSNHDVSLADAFRQR